MGEGSRSGFIPDRALGERVREGCTGRGCLFVLFGWSTRVGALRAIGSGRGSGGGAARVRSVRGSLFELFGLFGLLGFVSLFV